MIQIILAIIIALAGFPAGLLIAKLAEEELKAGRLWFRLLAIAAAIAIAASAIFAQGETMLFLITSFIFILLIAITSLIYPRLAPCCAKKSKRRYR
jgi:hypothetical protein